MDFDGYLESLQSVTSTGRKGTAPSKGIPRTKRSSGNGAVGKTSSAAQTIFDPNNLNVPSSWKTYRHVDYNGSHPLELVIFSSENSMGPDHPTTVNGRWPYIVINTAPDLESANNEAANLVDKKYGSENYGRRHDSVRIRNRN